MKLGHQRLIIIKIILKVSKSSSELSFTKEVFLIIIINLQLDIQFVAKLVSTGTKENHKFR